MITNNIVAMHTHATWMALNAHKVANVNTEGFDATWEIPIDDATLSSSPTGKATDLSKTLTEEIVIQRGFEAQTSAIKTQNSLLGTLLDMKG